MIDGDKFNKEEFKVNLKEKKDLEKIILFPGSLDELNQWMKHNNQSGIFEYTDEPNFGALFNYTKTVEELNTKKYVPPVLLYQSALKNLGYDGVAHFSESYFPVLGSGLTINFRGIPVKLKEK